MTLSTVLPRRASAPVNPQLERKLATYLAAAGAAGVGVMALSNTAEARVVYTPANITMGFNTAQAIDLNGDGTADVSLILYPLAKSFGMFAKIPAGNGVRLAGGEAAAGFFGIPVGPGEQFGGGGSVGLVPMYYKVFGYGNTSSYAAFGAWVNVPNRYLGVKFIIAGTTHYGWVRITTSKSSYPVITGYAYETTPNTKIKDGTVSGPAVAATELKPLIPGNNAPSLGALALGAPGLSIWRRSESESALSSMPVS